MSNGMRQRSIRRAFTLIELLVVIGIITVLASLVLAVVFRIQQGSINVTNGAQITKLATAIQAYFTTNGAYPGPIPESMIWGCNTRGTKGQQENLPFQSPMPFCVAGQTDITSSENLVMALLGGLTRDNTPGSLTFGQIIYDKNVLSAFAGPRALGNAPQQFSAYIDVTKTDLSSDSAGQLVSWTATYAQPGIARVFNIPEFMDGFSNPHPILYLRARAGAQGICDITIKPGPLPGGSQYYSMEMAPYWAVYKSTTDRTSSPNANNAPFPSTPDSVIGLPLWKDEMAFFVSPTLADNLTARSKDAFILISAGADGIYGTADDIIYGY